MDFLFQRIILGHTVDGVQVTKEQERAITHISSNWRSTGLVRATIGCDGAIVLPCHYLSGGTLYICIERDGYAHS